MEEKKKDFIQKILATKNLSVLVVITLCFMLWGFSNNVTTPMVNTFSKIFRISTTEALLVPITFSLAYFCMAFPAAIFIQKHSYKWGVVTGLALFAVGTLLFFPAKAIGTFYPFLGAYFILTCGLSFLETSSTPFIYCLGPEKSGTQRLNAAQAFNALGVVIGMIFVMDVHKHLSPLSTELRNQLPLGQFLIIKHHDLDVLIQPYIFIGALVLTILVLAILMKMPKDVDIHSGKGALDTLSHLIHKRHYRQGLVTEFCYIGAQVGVWTYMIHYGMRIFQEEGMMEQQAELTAEKYAIAAMICFAVCRFLCTWLMNWFNPSRLLSTMGIMGMAALLGTIIFTDRNGIYSMMLACGCFSLMFPTIYGIAVKGLGGHIKIAAAGLTMCLLGGTFFPLIQEAIIQLDITLLGLPAINLSFVVPLICIGVVVWYAHKAYVRIHITGDVDDSTSTPSTEVATTE